MRRIVPGVSALVLLLAYAQARAEPAAPFSLFPCGFSPEARDFRLMTIGKAYQSSPLRPDDKGGYVGRVPKPEAGWTAFFVELVFDSGDDKAPFKFTTQVQIVPDVLPHSFDEFRKTLK